MNLAELIIAALLACPNLDISSRTAGDDYFSEYECRISEGERGIIVRTALVADLESDAEYFCILSYTLTENLNTKPSDDFYSKNCGFLRELKKAFVRQRDAKAAKDNKKATEILEEAIK